MKTLKDLTPEIRAKIPKYKSIIRDALYSGAEHKTNKRIDTVRYIEEVYKIAKKEKPVVIIAKNPLQYKLFFVALHNPKIFKKIVMLRSMKNKSTKRINIDKELMGELESKLNSELWSELDGELWSGLNGELDRELRSELDRELDRELRSELDGELGGELRSELDGELGGELRSELDGELETAYPDGKKIIIKSHWLYLCSVYSRVYLTWYKFIQDEFKIKCSKQKELDYLYSLINKTFITRCFFNKYYVLVLKTPNKIIRNNIGFHNVHGGAICFEGGYNMYYINGRKVTKDLIDMKFTLQDFMSEDNEDMKGAMIEIIRERKGQEALMDFLGADVVDTKTITHSSGHSEIVKLYKTKAEYPFLQDRHGKMGQPYCWSEMTCPSTNTAYLIENSADFTDAIEAMKFLRPSFVPQELKYDFTNFNN
jgi:hypothetical protein